MCCCRWLPSRSVYSIPTPQGASDSSWGMGMIRTTQHPPPSSLSTQFPEEASLSRPFRALAIFYILFLVAMVLFMLRSFRPFPVQRTPAQVADRSRLRRPHSTYHVTLFYRAPPFFFRKTPHLGRIPLPPNAEWSRFVAPRHFY